MTWRSTLFVLMAGALAASGAAPPAASTSKIAGPPKMVANRSGVSPEISRAIAAELPRYVPVAPAPAPAALHEDGEIVRLPKLVVYAPRAPAIEERDLWSKAGFSALLYRRYPGASFWGQDPDHSPLPNYAALMYWDDQRRRQMEDLSNLAAVLRRAGDAAGSRELRKLIEGTFLREEDWKTEGMDKSLNAWRR